MAKHGNRAVSSASGSADVLEALGFQLDLARSRIEESIDTLGFGFLFAPPIIRRCAMRRPSVASSRPERSSTSSARSPTRPGPGPRSSASTRRIWCDIAQVLVQLGAERAYVVHGADGIDELSPTGPNLVAEVVEAPCTSVIDPLESASPAVRRPSLRGLARPERGDILRIFAGERALAGTRSF